MSDPRLDPLGITEPICPYCKAPLLRMPKRKTDCSSCRRPIFVRSRPLDRQKVLLKEEELPLLEEQWEIAAGRSPRPEDNIGEVSDTLSDADQWARQGHWGMYRNARRGFAAIRLREKNFREALAVFFEVCYLDLNGPCNNAEGVDKAVAPDRFRPHTAFLAPAVVMDLIRALKAVGLDRDNAHTLFLKVAKERVERLRPPISPEKAWAVLAEEIFSEKSDRNPRLVWSD